MSFDISLEYPDGRELKVDRIQEGGTQAIGGTDKADLNVTYNYSLVANLAGVHIRGLDGSKASDTVGKLTKAVELLGTHQHDDYWADTSGNVGFALNILLGWAKQHHDAVWSVT